MATTHSCDRCGSTISDPKWFVALKQEGVYPEWKLLCEACAESFEEWLGGANRISEALHEKHQWEQKARDLAAKLGYSNPDYLEPDTE